MNKILTIFLAVLLSLPICVWAVDDNSETSNVDKTTIENEYKQPISKRKIAKKFLAAMGGVGISSFAIFFMLTAYNRIRENFSKSVKTIDGEVSLESPEDLDDAVKVFLEKTKW